MAKKTRFDGPLGTPIKRRQPGLLRLLLNDDEIKQRLEEWNREDFSKLWLLCQHYGISDGPGMFAQLSITLARELRIPGFVEQKPRGRKAKWTPLNKGVLVVEIERIVNPDDPAHGVTWAAITLANRKPWKSFLEAEDSITSDHNPAEALRKVYYDFRNDEWARRMREDFKLHEQKGEIDKWDSRVGYL